MIGSITLWIIGFYGYWTDIYQKYPSIIHWWSTNWFLLPSGKLTYNYWQSQFLMGQLTINGHVQWLSSDNQRLSMPGIRTSVARSGELCVVGLWSFQSGGWSSSNDVNFLCCGTATWQGRGTMGIIWSYIYIYIITCNHIFIYIHIYIYNLI